MANVDLSGLDSIDLTGIDDVELGGVDLSGIDDIDLSGLDDEPAVSLEGMDGIDLSGIEGIVPDQGDYSALRMGVTNLAESFIGFGTEADAAIRYMSGDYASFDDAHNAVLKDMNKFERQNEFANYLTTGAGFAAGFLIPAGSLAKAGQAANAAAKWKAVGKAAGQSAAISGVIGYGMGDDTEERLQGAAIGATLGGALTAGAGKFLVKSQDELAEIAKKTANNKAKGSFLAGEEGFNQVKAAKTPAMGKGADASNQARGVAGVAEDAVELADDAADAYGTLRNIGRSTKAWMEHHISPRFARLAEDAESMGRQGRYVIDKGIDDSLSGAIPTLRNNDKLKTLLLRVNPELGADPVNGRLTWEAILTMDDLTDAERAAVKSIKVYAQKLQAADPANLKMVDGKPQLKTTDYMPSKALKAIKNQGSVGRTDQYDDPIEALRSYAYEISDARAIYDRMLAPVDESGELAAKIFERSKIAKTGERTPMSRVKATIEAVVDKAKLDGADEATIQNIRNGLESQFIHARQGGNAAGAVIRRLTSTGLLANWSNAALNVVEGVTAPIYENGFKAWMQTVPKGIVSTFAKKAGMKAPDWLDDTSMGLGGTYMGEIAQTGTRAFDDTSGMVKAIMNPDWVRTMDKGSEAIYKLSGVDTVNRMSREMLTNSTINKAKSLALKAFKGDTKAQKKLMETTGMRGLLESEKEATMRALKKYATDPSTLTDTEAAWVMNYAGTVLNKWQPVSASSMPKAFHDNPNGRMMYSMLSYMNRQMNNIIEDIGGNFAKAAELGINTPAGQKAMLEAYKNGGKYVGIFGGLAGTWNTARMGLDPSKDNKVSDVFSVEGMSGAAVNELVSNMSMGMINLRANQYGKKPLSAESVIPAPVSAGFDIASGALQLPFDIAQGTPFSETDAAKAAQNYIPGISTADRYYRAATGERMLTGDGTGKGLLTGRNGTLETGMLYDLINQGR